MAAFIKRYSVSCRAGIVSAALLIIIALLLTSGSPDSQITWLSSASAEEQEDIVAPDFTLLDQYGNEHTLSQYRGKVVFLNFWATWCEHCVQEMPDIEKLYHELGENQEDVVFLGVASPLVVDRKNEAGIISFLQLHGCTYPVLMDKTGEIFQTYYARALPTTWLIRKDGILMGYIPGALSKDQMQEVIQQTSDAASAP